MSDATKNAARKGALAATTARKSRAAARQTAGQGAPDASDMPTLADVLNGAGAEPSTRRGQVALWEGIKPLILLFKSSPLGEGWIDCINFGHDNAEYVPCWFQADEGAYWVDTEQQWFELDASDIESMRG